MCRNSRGRIPLALAGLALGLALVFSASAVAQAPRKDFQIFKDVSSAVLTYPQFTIFDDVRASVDRGAVTLAGKVTMPFKRHDIETRVARIDGVTRVVNRIDVLPVSTSDDELRFVLARQIYGNSAFWQYASMPNPPIHIVVEHGRVTLAGVVSSNVERVLARSIAATTFGVLSVTNELKTDAEVEAEMERRVD